MTHSADIIIYRNLEKYYRRQIYNKIIHLARDVYKNLSWGWHESVYREALAYELSQHGYHCRQEIVKPIMYKGQELSHVNARLDILIEKGGMKMIIELKADGATKHTMIKAEQQCKRYLTLMGLHYGMVINFPEREFRDILFIPIYHKNNKYLTINLKPPISSLLSNIPSDNPSLKTSINQLPKKKSAVKHYLYDKTNRELAKTEQPGIKGIEITSYLSRKWKSLDEEEKRKWDLDNIKV